jgi:phosphatidylglycerophosphate synthase
MSESIKELREICQATRENEFLQMSWFSKNCLRKVSIYFTKLFLLMKISANQATFIGLLMGIAAGIFLTFGSALFWIIGALLLYLFLVFDDVDGEIARYTKTASPRGAFWDATSGWIVWQFTLACASFGIYNALHEIVALVFGFGAIALLFLYNALTLLPYSVLHEKGLLPEALKGKPEKSFTGVLRYGQSIFGHAMQGLTHGILVTSLIDCFLSPFVIAGFLFNFRFLYLMVYVVALLFSVIMKIYNVHHLGVRVMRF